MGKKSTRKHKKWEDDGTLEVTGKRAVVKVIIHCVYKENIHNPLLLNQKIIKYISGSTGCRRQCYSQNKR